LIHAKAIQELSIPRRTNMMAEAAKAPEDQKPSQEAPERLLHTGLVPATVVTCWDWALGGGGAEAWRARDTCDTCHAAFRRQTVTFPSNLSGISFRTAV
jgi:hypothetical protein